MCDEHTAEDGQRFSNQNFQLTRRRFVQLGAGAALAMVLPAVADANKVVHREVAITTPDGEAEGYFVHPESGRHPGVLMWPDALGLRPAFRAMAKRLAESGYAVLVINPYYRTARAPVIPEGATFSDPGVRDIVMPLMGTLNAETQVVDARAFVAFLDGQDAVDTERKIGTMGYCMGGAMVMRTAAAEPQRIGAGATFHGGGMATDKSDSPHLLVPTMTAHFLVAIAADDDERDPRAKELLREAFDRAGLPAEIEVYQDTRHGWCVPDFPVYHEEQAERAWSRTLALFAGAL